MKIESSNVAMSAQHRFTSSEYVETMKLEVQDGAQYMKNVSELAEQNGKNLVQSMKDYEKQEAEESKKRQQQNLAKSMMEYMDRMRNCQNSSRLEISDETELQIKLLRKLLAALSGRGRIDPLELEQYKKGSLLDLRSSNYKRADMIAAIRGEGGSAPEASAAPVIGTNVTGTTWHRITAASGYYAESEFTAFQSEGLVKTEDGRSISFGIEVNMSRSFTEQIDMFSDETFIKTDPLIINLNTDAATVSDVKFRFDLDADGRSEEISFAGEGSGFLALDKDGNGSIDDGSELFGTKSGDGFADLAEYDGDGNGWIDENDEVFSRLRVWVRDSEGNDRLLNLKEADVGALYLNNADTEFSLKNNEHHTNGIIQKTGVYLKESGGVGTVNHVDLTM